MNPMDTYQQWLNNPHLGTELHDQLVAMRDNPREIEESFAHHLEFGTGGMRGIMGVGTNRMNTYTVGKATTGLAHFLWAHYGEQAAQKGVVIAYDCRNQSRAFAEQSALVFATLGIKAWLFDQLSPTPELSFAVTYLGAVAGIVVTASHNPKEYNGYKVYNHHGYQVISPAAEAIVEHSKQVDRLPVITLTLAQAIEQGLIQCIGDAIHQAFLQAVSQQALLQSQEAIKQQLRVVYTPLHGTGWRPVTEILAQQGFGQLHIVQKQAEPDGDFPTVHSPNPEDPQALQMAISQGEAIDAHLIMGTDPDCDRIGIAVHHQEQYQLLTGNQVGALLTHFILSQRQHQLSSQATMVTTIVTSQLGADIARSYGVQVLETLTGFKYIGEKITQFNEDHSHQFILGYEESYGYLIGTHAKDKDGVVTALLICEMTAYYLDQGYTLVDILDQLYKQYGFYFDHLQSITLQGLEGQAKIAQMMADFRECPPKVLGEHTVTVIKDYSLGIDQLPKANVLKYILDDGSWLAIRPSGTEPKIKFYYGIRGENQAVALRKYQAIDLSLAQLIN